MTPVILTPTFTNPNRRRRQVSGALIGETPAFWVVRIEGEPFNQVLEHDQWERA